MTPKQFIDRYSEYFGECAPLPLAVVYSDSPLSREENVPGCMFKRFYHAYVRMLYCRNSGMVKG